MASFLKQSFSKFSSAAPRLSSLKNLSRSCKVTRFYQSPAGNGSAVSLAPFRSFSSDADREFLNILNEEVRLEKEQMYEIPLFGSGWKAARTGPDCKVTKSHQGDSITVSFNVNGSVPPLESDDPSATDEVRAEPDFMVDVKKGSETLTFECFYPNDDPAEHQYDEKDSNFCIRSLTVHHGEITETTYSMETEHLDQGLYDSLMNYLKARGIDNIFADELAQYATAVENNCYIQSLERLQGFLRK